MKLLYLTQNGNLEEIQHTLMDEQPSWILWEFDIKEKAFVVQLNMEYQDGPDVYDNILKVNQFYNSNLNSLEKFHINRLSTDFSNINEKHYHRENTKIYLYTVK